MSNELNEDSYVRWLRARQPQPINFFLNLSDLEQEVLAGLGDDYTQDVTTAMAYTVRDPDAVFAAMGDPDAEERLAQRVAGEMLERAAAKRGEATPPPSPGMSGITNRREQRAFQESEKERSSKRLFGVLPDSKTEVPAVDTLETEENTGVAS